jgi:ZIP family zinc transporter
MTVSDPVLLGTFASLMTALATALGALPVLHRRAIPDAARDALLGIAAGVMLAATFFSLIEPAIEMLQLRHGSRSLAAVYLSMALTAGAASVALLERWLANAYGWDGCGDGAPIRQVWVFIAAVTLHNIPEGIAVGVGFGSGDMAHGTAIATAIGLQNMPEGLAVALALVSHGYDRRRAFLAAVLTGAVEVPAGLLGAAAVSLFQPILPWAMAAAAGAMLFVVVDELIPEAHSHGHRDAGTGGFIAGFIVMLMLDVALA